MFLNLKLISNLQQDMCHCSEANRAHCNSIKYNVQWAINNDVKSLQNTENRNIEEYFLGIHNIIENFSLSQHITNKFNIYALSLILSQEIWRKTIHEINVQPLGNPKNIYFNGGKKIDLSTFQDKMLSVLLISRFNLTFYIKCTNTAEAQVASYM